MHHGLRLDIAKAGSTLGSGAVIVMDDSRDMVECSERLSTSTSTIVRPVHPLP